MQPNLTIVGSPKDDIEIEHITNVLKNDFNLYESDEESLKRQEILVTLKKCVMK